MSAFRNLQKFFFLLFLLALVPVHSLAAQPADSYGGLWTTFSLQGKAISRLHYFLEAHLRSGLAPLPVRPQSLLIVPGVGVDLLPHLHVWLGYTNVSGFAWPGRDEHRILQQVVYDRVFDELRALWRVRLEERFLSGSSEVSLRLRLLLRAAIPLDDAKLWRVVVQNESFLNLNTVTNGPMAGLDQNRAQVSVQRQLFPAWTMELGYQLQYQLFPTRADLLSHNIIWVNSFRLPDANQDDGAQE